MNGETITVKSAGSINTGGDMEQLLSKELARCYKPIRYDDLCKLNEHGEIINSKAKKVCTGGKINIIATARMAGVIVATVKYD